jgi:transmembrane sensor
MNNEETSFEQLAIRYLRGELNDEEYEELLALLQDQQNRSRFYTLKNSWMPEKNERAQKNWHRLARRINLNPLQKKVSKSRVIRQAWFLKVAAVLIVGLLITTVWFYHSMHDAQSGITVVETPRGEKSKIYLPDGTEIWLNASSRISYHAFTNKSRRISLTGEAYFKVARNEDSPFTVQTPNCAIRVLGTEFNVMAYDQLKREEITLFKGKVNVTTGQRETMLWIGEKLLVSGNTFVAQKVDLDQTYGWVENKFNFSKVTLEELVLRLENWYDVDIECGNINKQQTLFTGTFKNEETIWEVLDALKAYLPVSYKKTETRKIELMIK